MEKLIHVSCVVRESNVWELLRALEEHKAGNVEVRPVAPKLLALPAPRRSVRHLVHAAMPMKEKRRVRDVIQETGAKKQSVYTALCKMVQSGLAKRVDVGLYMRVKPDPVSTQTNGADAS